MKITLQVNGQEMAFSEQELSSILEEYFSSRTTKKSKATKKAKTAKVVQKPIENEWFEIKPQAIDQKLFQNRRKNVEQEATRKLILEAFAEMKDNPEKYGKNFETLMPKQTWSLLTPITIKQLKEMASELGDHNADWVEQALEWAQRIANGESWESVCNDADTANCYRLVVWKNGYARFVGSPPSYYDYLPASHVEDFDHFDNDRVIDDVVPLVVFYE